MIRVLRRYYRWNFLTSSTFEAQLELTVKITEKKSRKQKYILLPAGSYRGDLKITNVKGDELIILSDEEFEKINDVPISAVNKHYIDQMSQGLDSEQKRLLLKNHRLIAVILPEKKQKEYYEKITMSWISKFPNTEKIGNTEAVVLPCYIHRNDFKSEQNCAVYVSVKTVSPYRIFNELNFSNQIDLTNPPEYAGILNDSMHKIFRLKETTQSQLVAFTIQLAISKHLEDWARISFIGTALVPIFIIGLTFYKNEIPPFSYEILGGLIVFLIGQKAFIFQDAKLLSQWNKSHLVITIGISLLLLMLILLVLFGLINQTQIIYDS